MNAEQEFPYYEYPKTVYMPDDKQTPPEGHIVTQVGTIKIDWTALFSEENIAM